jgi:Uncharacterized protein conserved in bacteria (DUF2332)
MAVRAAEHELAALARRYRRFAREEAAAECPIYAALAEAVASAPELLAFLAGLPEDKRQPNLFLAAVRHLDGVPDNGAQLAEIVRRRHEALRALMLSRATQTNEPARCAVLLPVLARLPQPLALIEVGASAGLCLYPDRYAYDYGSHRLEPPQEGTTPPVFACAVGSPAPLPLSALPQIVWRAGLDLNPLDLSHPADMAWLETLIWPGQDARLARFRAAAAIVRRNPPHLIRGNLAADLAPLIAAAPRDATLVVFHSAVLAYAAPAERRCFRELIERSQVRWLCNEAPGVFPEFAAMAPPAPGPDRFLLALDGKPLAWTGAHGQLLDWFAPP